MSHVLAFDIGTGGVHVNVIDRMGRFAGSAYEEIRYNYVKEYDGLDWDAASSWESSIRAAEKAIAESGVPRDGIVAAAVTSQRHGMVFTDGDGLEILACPNLDGRAAPQVERFAAQYGERVYDLTARWPDVYFPALRLLWLRDNRPDDFARVARILMVNEYFIYKLTGRMCSEWTNAAETMLFDTGNRAWSADMIRLFGFEKLRMNDLAAPGDVVERIRPELAGRLGIGRIPVIAAVSDTQAAVLGSGFVELGDVVAVNGSTTPVLMIEDHFLKDPLRRIWVDPYLKNRWLLESNCLQSGMVHRKLLDHLAELIRMIPGQESFDRDDLYRLLEKLEDRTDGVVSYFGSRRFHVSKKDSKRLQITFPNEQTNVFAAILPSYVENLAFAIAANIEQLEEISGRRVSRLCLTGGGSRSAHLKRIMPALLADREVVVTRDLETTSRGAAIQAWTAVGEYADVEAAIREMSASGWYDRLTGCYAPRLHERYQMWRELYG
ncbi:MAG: FGGY-family carbohydrate kinase [Planctomycetota bacterium]|jgi:autoinducer 2 (AI-2) kinase|nr:FGGY-family carbohydrate kinase [Planctomycetota bacterium]